MVAALTLPNLVANYRNIVYVNQLKKSVSVLEQAFIKMLADEGVEHLEDVSGFKTLGTAEYASYVFGGTHGDAFEKYLKRYLNIVSIGRYSSREFAYLEYKLPAGQALYILKTGQCYYIRFFIRSSK